MTSFTKDPQAVLDYLIDWGSTDVASNRRWLEAADTIATSTWTVPAGITKTFDTHDDKTATVWLSGGTDGASYTLTNRITTADGREDERSITIVLRSR